MINSAHSSVNAAFGSSRRGFSTSRARRWSRTVLFALAFVALCSTAKADESFTVNVYATGTIVSRTICSANVACQHTIVAGGASHIGQFEGVIDEYVNLPTGTYSGTASFTTPSGDAFETQFTGQVVPIDNSGDVVFFERHVVIGGTGRFLGAQGQLRGVGSADAAGQVQFVATGTLTP
jgi:hypothetical protein